MIDIDFLVLFNFCRSPTFSLIFRRSNEKEY